MSRTQIIVDDRDEGGNTHLMRAALDGQTETVESLLLKGADVNAQNRDGRTALMFAIINLRTTTVKKLLQFGADVNVQAHCGCTPLMLAAGSGDIEITKALLNRGADPTRICSPSKTALAVAVDRGYTNIVALLKRTLGQSTQVKPESLPSEFGSRKRARVFSPTRAYGVRLDLTSSEKIESAKESWEHASQTTHKRSE
jgi:ankyrin repeat protein